MADEINAKPAPPPRGMILVDGKWQVRRFGLITQRGLTCIFGHRIRLGLVPFEVAAPCDYREKRESQRGCNAQLYLFTTRARLIWAMDVTRYECELIELTNMEPAEIIDYFGVGFPVDMKIARLIG